MFDVFPKALASVASFLFPLFASYKALNSSDPAQLTPWLMYWVVLSCLVFVESWIDWLLFWVPFYHYFRLFFILYLVLPQTQGARILYQTHLHPWLARHEARIDEFIGSAHDRLRSAGMHYLKQAVSYLRTVLGLPGLEAESPSAAAASSSSAAAAATPQGYTQALLARFTLPGARWPGGAAGAAAAGGGSGGGVGSGTASGNNSGPSSADLYNLLASAVGALGTATGAAGGAAAGVAASAFSSSASFRGGSAAAAAPAATDGMTASDRASFLATQRDRLRTLLSVLDREAAQLGEQAGGGEPDSPLLRPPSGASSRGGGGGDGGGLSKSRSEPDFEKIDAESGTEEERPAAGVRQRRPGASSAATGAADPATAGRGAQGRSASGSWMPWAWGGGGAGGDGTQGQ